MLTRRAASNLAAVKMDLAGATIEGDTDRMAALEELVSCGADIVAYRPQLQHYILLFGNIDTAEHVVIVVPGVADGTDLREDWIPQAVELYERSPASAVILWKGYDNPVEVPDLLAPSIECDADLQSAASELAAFVDSLELEPSQSLNILTHGLGGIVTGAALADFGLSIDELVVAGHPEMTADDLRKLHLRQAHVAPLRPSPAPPSAVPVSPAPPPSSVSPGPPASSVSPGPPAGSPYPSPESTLPRPAPSVPPEPPDVEEESLVASPALPEVSIEEFPDESVGEDPDDSTADGSEVIGGHEDSLDDLASDVRPEDDGVEDAFLGQEDTELGANESLPELAGQLVAWAVRLPVAPVCAVGRRYRGPGSDMLSIVCQLIDVGAGETGSLVCHALEGGERALQWVAAHFGATSDDALR